MYDWIINYDIENLKFLLQSLNLITSNGCNNYTIDDAQKAEILNL